MDGRQDTHKRSTTVTAGSQKPRLFHLGDILSITTGCLVSPDLIDGVYQIMNWMTQDNLFTHQLVTAQPACSRSLKEQLPFTASTEFPRWLTGKGEDAIREWLAGEVAKHGEFHPVSPLPRGEWEHRTFDGVLDDLREIAPQAEVLVVIAPDEDAAG